jgi:hypothetical protein
MARLHMITGREIFTILRTCEKLGFEPAALGRLFRRAPALPLLFRRLYFLAGKSVLLGAFPPASRKAVSERGVVSVWFDSLLALDRLARLTPAAIFCWNQARFGRFCPQEAGYWTWPLIRAGVRLVTTDKGLIPWDDFTDWLTYSVDQHAKHQYIIDLSRDVTRGQLASMKGGSWVGSPPYAYRLEGPKKNKRLVLGDPGHVRVVQRIFREFVYEGRLMKNIADRLNEEGVVSPGGRVKGWRYDTMRVILENPAYTGDYATGRYSFGKYHTISGGEVAKANGRCRRKQEEWILHTDHHEPIIDRDTWEKAQARLAQGKTGRSPYTPETNPYVLSGLLRCGKCGSALYGLNNGKYRYYECGNFHYNGTESCEGTTVKERDVLRSVADHLENWLGLDADALGTATYLPWCRP